MPIGVAQGSRVEVVAQFSDAKGNSSVPPPPLVFLDIAYTDAVLGSTAAVSINMRPIGASFIAAWNSSAAAIGQAVLSFTIGPVTLSPPDPILLINRNT